MTTQTPYLEMSFRHGKPFAAYIYLDRRPGDVSARTQRFEPGLIIDYTADGRPIGLEITALSHVTLDSINCALAAAKHPPIAPADLAPLRAAG